MDVWICQSCVSFFKCHKVEQREWWNGINFNCQRIRGNYYKLCWLLKNMLCDQVFYLFENIYILPILSNQVQEPLNGQNIIWFNYNIMWIELIQDYTKTSKSIKMFQGSLYLYIG